MELQYGTKQHQQVKYLRMQGDIQQVFMGQVGMTDYKMVKDILSTRHDLKEPNIN